METFQHCRDKCLHSVVSGTTNLGVYPTRMIISAFPPIDACSGLRRGPPGRREEEKERERESRRLDSKLLNH